MKKLNVGYMRVSTSDGMQSLYFKDFEKLMRNLNKVLKLKNELE